MTDTTPRETKKAHAVVTNSDLTEGRGQPVILCICELEATARRMAKGKGVMGTDAKVEPVELEGRGAQWIGPVDVIGATREDMKAQIRLDATKATLKKARDLGLTEHDIAILRA